MNINKQKLQALVSQILNEEVKKRSVTGQEIYNRVPEVVHAKEYKDITPYKRDTMSKMELLADMQKVVNDINKEYTCVWDDHDDISISARDLFRIRIVPRWENNYDIEAFIRNEDRMLITGQKWEQVKEFVKTNLKSDDKTHVDKAADKVIKNREDQTGSNPKGLSQDNKPKLMAKIGDTKNKEKRFNEPAVKNEDDLPEKPMKEVKEFIKQIDHKSKLPEKPKKKADNDKHVIKMN